MCPPYPPHPHPPTHPHSGVQRGEHSCLLARPPGRAGVAVDQVCGHLGALAHPAGQRLPARPPGRPGCAGGRRGTGVGPLVSTGLLEARRGGMVIVAAGLRRWRARAGRSLVLIVAALSVRTAMQRRQRWRVMLWTIWSAWAPPLSSSARSCPSGEDGVHCERAATQPSLQLRLLRIDPACSVAFKPARP